MKKMEKLPEIPLITGNAPFEYAEAYKTLRTNFNFLAANSAKRKLLVTSSVPDEGKTSVTINLALSLAQIGKKVLLVDADMRNPSLHRYLRVKWDKEKGLTAILTGSAELQDCIMETVHGFDLIPGGIIPPNPAELVSSKAMNDMLEKTLESYDFVICDTPPVGVVTDAAAASTLCDGVLFVVRQKATKKPVVQEALRRLETVHAKVLGVVMNYYDMRDMSKREYGYYSNYMK